MSGPRHTAYRKGQLQRRAAFRTLGDQLQGPDHLASGFGDRDRHAHRQRPGLRGEFRQRFFVFQVKQGLPRNGTHFDIGCRGRRAAGCHCVGHTGRRDLLAAGTVTGADNASGLRLSGRLGRHEIQPLPRLLAGATDERRVDKRAPGGLPVSKLELADAQQQVGAPYILVRQAVLAGAQHGLLHCLPVLLLHLQLRQVEV